MRSAWLHFTELLSASAFVQQLAQPRIEFSMFLLRSFLRLCWKSSRVSSKFSQSLLRFPGFWAQQHDKRHASAHNAGWDALVRAQQHDNNHAAPRYAEAQKLVQIFALVSSVEILL